MKGYRFYLEYPNKTEKRKATVKQPGNHSGNVVAIYEGSMFIGSCGPVYEAAAAILYSSNSPVGTSSVSPEYLRDNCKRIPEALAREIHPKLFDYLEA